MSETYESLDAQLTGRNKDRRKLTHNTYVERRGDDIAIRLHETDVLTFRPDGSVSYDTGGWFTVTTKDRMNRYGPTHISSRQGRWFAWGTPYVDGMTVRDGLVIAGVDAEAVAAEDQRNAKARKAIDKFIKGITPERIMSAWEDTGGDCWGCKFGMATDCLAGHVKDSYFHASLAYRAVKAAGYRAPDLIMAMIYRAAQRGQVDTLLTRPLRKLLRKELLTGIAVK
jgi:hypothetical protein